MYMAWTGCQWWALPLHFLPGSPVQRYFYVWRDSGQPLAVFGIQDNADRLSHAPQNRTNNDDLESTFCVNALDAGDRPTAG